jgi:hypothetical protein
MFWSVASSGGAGVAGDGFIQFLAGRLAAVQVRDPVVRDAVEIRPQVVARPLAGCQDAQEAAEGLGDAVFRDGRISKQAHGVTIQFGAVLIVDLRQRPRVELAGKTEEFGLGGRFQVHPL